ncbi:metallophosphoesterase [Methylocella silvestris BL2]|uniref:Metallophosphoesterase n=1 Tax=Methylocella silvestris (strain DSM 15510 / CIP 108128 / LMG 27833 / NCIMB 13906 / BL2) TaxID=395965 RepID=B8ENM5_METSB|nr:metallophosphoesterase [Methylocella silvestris BL2]
MSQPLDPIRRAQSEAPANAPSDMSDFTVARRLEKRLGPVYARQRIGIEEDHEAQAFGQGLNFFHIENWYSVHAMMRLALRLCGVFGRGQRNAAKVELRRNEIVSRRLPAAFDGFTLLHLSDLHVEMSAAAMLRAAELIEGLDYDICVMTGDYRARTFGGFKATLDGMAPLLSRVKSPIYGVLGNHDTIKMTPALEDLGVTMLLNESVRIDRGGTAIHIGGIDDAHFFRVDNIEKVAVDIPFEDFSLLLSHTPEIYRQAAHAGFDAILSGHTHGGQICLPGGFPLTLDSVLPRAFGAGAWKYNEMSGYTSTGAGSSVLPVRFNCPPEVTLHRLRRE